MSHDSERLLALINAERSHLASGPAGGTDAWLKLSADVAAGVPAPFDLPWSAVPSTLGAFSLTAVGLSVGTTAVLIAAGVWFVVSTPAPSPPAPSPPTPSPAVMSSSTSGPRPAPPPTPPQQPPPVRGVPPTAPPPLTQPPPSPPPSPSPEPGTLIEELRLLRKAQVHLKKEQLKDALSVLEEHARRFPEGQVAEERQALQAITLCKLGRPEGREAAKAFLQAHPASPQAPRVKLACLDG